MLCKVCEVNQTEGGVCDECLKLMAKPKLPSYPEETQIVLRQIFTHKKVNFLVEAIWKINRNSTPFPTITPIKDITISVKG